MFSDIFPVVFVVGEYNNSYNMNGRAFRIQDYSFLAQNAHRMATNGQRAKLEEVLKRGVQVMEVSRMGVIRVGDESYSQAITPTGQLVPW